MPFSIPTVPRFDDFSQILQDMNVQHIIPEPTVQPLARVYKIMARALGLNWNDQYRPKVIHSAFAFVGIWVDAKERPSRRYANKLNDNQIRQRLKALSFMVSGFAKNSADLNSTLYPIVNPMEIEQFFINCYEAFKNEELCFTPT